jgi:hypothetical protein
LLCAVQVGRGRSVLIILAVSYAIEVVVERLPELSKYKMGSKQQFVVQKKTKKNEA